MASAAAGRIDAHEERNLPFSPTKERSDQICARCGGLLVSHICMDLQNSGTELEFAAKRCVQCGDVVDSVILRNRRIAHGSHPAPAAESPTPQAKLQLGA